MTTKYHNQLKTEHERKDALEEELYALENAIDPGESAKDLAKDLSVKTDPLIHQRMNIRSLCKEMGVAY
eukprot:TRINITY_DN964_c0_g1_i1.p2 TRINITY_DN964_c0_g1~~TRINITY_DN964_c0_g1_i1.p2  ORF type:complete len:69 (-),score=4.50 TRINITY_DN964_c0_g1_i1:182-388(-)